MLKAADALKHPPDVNVSKQPKAKAGWEWLSDFLLEGVHNIANQSLRKSAKRRVTASGWLKRLVRSVAGWHRKPFAPVSPEKVFASFPEGFLS